MKKEQVEILIDEQKQFWARTKDGTEYRIDVFEGGGYYAALWPRTEVEIEEAKRRAEEEEKRWRAEMMVRAEKRNAPWHKRIFDR